MEAYEALRIEIVKSAVFDLKKALRRSDMLGEVCEEQIKLENWFLSKWGQLLSGDNGAFIIEKCHKEYKTKVSKNGRPYIPDDLQNRIIADYKAGLTRRAILSKHGISIKKYENAIRRWRSEI